MKILTVCQRGNSRSVGLGWILKERLGHDVIACGAQINSSETLRMLCDWADKIIVVDKRLADYIPGEYKDKLKIWDVGVDRYFRGFDDDLIDQYDGYLLTEGLE